MKMTSRIVALAGAVAGAVVMALSAMPAVRAQTEPGRSTIGGSGPMKDELDVNTRAAVDKGLAWLAKNATPGASTEGGDSIAIMSLAGLALLADGSLPNDGRYGRESANLLEYVLKNCQESGLIAAPNNSQPMYGHGFATLYLAEAYGMSPRNDVGEKLHNAIRLIVNTQQPGVGGWRYQALPNDSDISVTICQIMALRAARNAGVKVPNSTIDAAVQYVRKSQEPDGGFRYVLNSGGSAYPRSAAGVACLYYTRTGNAFAEEIKRGIDYLKARTPGAGRGMDSEGNFYYGNYYATQAMFMYGGTPWEGYWPAIRTTLLGRQDKATGNWSGETGPIYATSMALIMLQVPNRLLPILQK
jgi:hypothetical protein